MAKPGYGMIYAIVIILGILAVELFNRMMNSDEAAPAAKLRANKAAAGGEEEERK